MRKVLRISFLTLLLISLLSACISGAEPQSVCGDGVCAPEEDINSCPSDCEIRPEIQPSETPAPTPTEEIDPLGYVNFAIYVSDFVNHDQSAETVLALIDLFEQNAVQGEFYLTAPMTHIFAQEHGEVIDRLREAGMGISYNIKPPHPLVPGFQSPISGLPVDQTERMVNRYETERIDLETGRLIPDEPGGYTYIKELFGAPPVAVDAPFSSRSGFVLPILARLGARVVVLPRETDPQQPFDYQYSMLVRPTDITINRWEVDGVEGARSWWEMLGTEWGPGFQPSERLQDQLSTWDSERLPIVFVPMQEYYFYRSGPVPWRLIYYQDTEGSAANNPPFDLNAMDPSSARPDDEQQALWDAYSRMVEWSSIYADSVTSMDILVLANSGG